MHRDLVLRDTGAGQTVCIRDTVSQEAQCPLHGQKSSEQAVHAQNLQELEETSFTYMQPLGVEGTCTHTHTHTSLLKGCTPVLADASFQSGF